MTTSVNTEVSSTPDQPSSTVARREPRNGSPARLIDGAIEVPTPIENGYLSFTPGERRLNDMQMTILGPLGIKPDWDAASVLNWLVDAARRGFDPFAKEIYLMRYKTREGLQYIHHIGIHGMRRHVEMTRTYGGLVTELFCGDDGVWREEWLYRDAAPYGCKAIMKRTDWDERIQKIGYYDEFAPLKDEYVNDQKTGNKVPTPMWLPAAAGGKPTIMLGKCTRAMGFREGWPALLGGWFAAEEFERVEVDAVNVAADERAARRDQAYAESLRAGRPTIEGEATVLEDATPADRVRAMLLDELGAQAAILGQPLDYMVRRWQETRRRSWDTATVGEIAAHVRNIRGHVVTALRQQGRHEQAGRYAEAPMPGSLLELFGGDPRGAMAEQAAA